MLDPPPNKSSSNGPCDVNFVLAIINVRILYVTDKIHGKTADMVESQERPPSMRHRLVLSLDFHKVGLYFNELLGNRLQLGVYFGEFHVLLLVDGIHLF